MKDESNLAELIEVMARLRAPDGCPWDREQTHASLEPYLLEEAYEVLEAIEAGDDRELCAELGDVLLQVVFHAQIAAEEGRFTIGDVARAIIDKLLRRHPHVFADAQVEGAEEVVDNWEAIKRAERRRQGRAEPSALDGIPRRLPALMRAQRVQGRAARRGFDWQTMAGPLDKVEEELAEARRAWAEGDGEAVEEELGDLFFALVNVARFLQVDAEGALRRAVDKFERRFRAVEGVVRQQGKDMEQMSLEELDAIWEKVKAKSA